VEDAIYKHRDIKTVVVFGIPDPIWGERVGAAVILKEGVNHEQAALKKQLHKMLLADGLQPRRLPDQVIVVTEDDLPKTRSNKYIRTGLANALGLNSNGAREELKGMKPVNYHEAAVGVKFVLALAVMYVHIGNFENRDLSIYASDAGYKSAWEYTRSWYVRQRLERASKCVVACSLTEVTLDVNSRCWHTPIFFLVGGFLLAAGTHVPVTTRRDLSTFYSLRIAGLHAMYLISILFCTINFVARCRPSNYITDFDRLREPLEGEFFVCQATPIEWPYSITLIISLVSYAFALQSWSIMIPFSWYVTHAWCQFGSWPLPYLKVVFVRFLSYYTWFSSVYIFCIFLFPWCHQQYHAVRDDINAVWKLTLFWLGMNYLYAIAMSLLFTMDNEALKNYFALSSYLFPPGWFPCFACGIGKFTLILMAVNSQRTFINNRVIIDCSQWQGATICSDTTDPTKG
jgi:AMP-binding enzyme C-terminal domain